MSDYALTLSIRLLIYHGRKMMKLLKLAVFATPLFITTANSNASTTELAVHSLVERCLDLQSTLRLAFSKTSLETTQTKIEGTDNVSFYYQNFHHSFKGICSNAQFSVDELGITGTKDNQKYIYVWSKLMDAEALELSIDDVEFTEQAPDNTVHWLRKELSQN